MSLIEVLVAVLILSFIALGVVPLMMRSLADNNRAWEATVGSNLAQSQFEEVLDADFESPIFTIPAAATESEVTQAYTAGALNVVGDAGEGWTTDPPPAGRGELLWRRTVMMRQYNVDDIAIDSVAERNLVNPLRGDADPSRVNLKEIRVQFLSRRQGGPLGAGQNFYIHMLKSF